jgi:translation initiation factor 2 alpha subunit (eIF-2alpha)
MYFYSKKVPETNDIVFAKIIKFDNLGVKVKLIEYDDKEGYILYSNLSKRNSSDISQIYKQNKEIFIEYLGLFEFEWSFTDKNLDKEIIKDFDIRFHKYYKIINLVNSFIGLNIDINREYFLNKTLYNVMPSKESITVSNHMGDGTLTEYVIEDEVVDPFHILEVYDKIIEKNKMLLNLTEPVKSKFFEYIKKYSVDTSFNGNIKFESFSVNSCGLNDIKKYYTDIIVWAKENNINLQVRVDSLSNYIIVFDKEKYLENITNKVNILHEHIKKKEPNFNHKLISTSINEI